MKVATWKNHCNGIRRNMARYAQKFGFKRLNLIIITVNLSTGSGGAYDSATLNKLPSRFEQYVLIVLSHGLFLSISKRSKREIVIQSKAYIYGIKSNNGQNCGWFAIITLFLY